MNDIILDLLWAEYQEAVRKAQSSLINGEDNLKILGLATLAHKARSNYESELDRLLFEP